MNFQISLLLLGALYLSAPGPLRAQRYAIRNVHVIPMNREIVLTNQTVLIDNGLISHIGPAGGRRIGRGYVSVDGKDKFLMPGLMDMHVHFFQEQGEFRNTCREELKVMLANGLTTVRIMAGHPSYLAARDSVRRSRWTGPDLYVASPQLVGRWAWATQFKNYEITDTPEKAVSAVRQFREQGYDAIKLTFMLRRDMYDAIVRTAREENMPVVGHVGPDVKLPRALESGEQIEHMDEFIDMLLPDTSYNHGMSVSDMNIWRPEAWATVPFLDENRIPELARRVKQSGIYVSPTNFFFIACFGETLTPEQIKKRPDYGFIPSYIQAGRWTIRRRYEAMLPSEEKRRRYVDLRKKMVQALWQEGVPLMAGSDTPEWFLVSGFTLHDELKAFVDAGLTPFAALQTATVNPAAYLHILDQKGTVEVGKKADLILLDNNPLMDIRYSRSIDGVFRAGRWYDKNAVTEMLETARTVLSQ